MIDCEKSMNEDVTREEFIEFMEWIRTNKYNLPDWAKLDISMNECRLLWKEKIKSLTMKS